MPESFDLDDDYDPIGPPPSLTPEAQAEPPAAPPAAPLPSRRAPQPATPQRVEPDDVEDLDAPPPTAGPPHRAQTGTIRPPVTGTVRPPGSVPPPARPGTGSIGPGSSGPPSRSGASLPGTGPVGRANPNTIQPATNTRQTGTQVGVPPHTKASDLLRGHPNYKAQEGKENKPRLPFLTEERRPTRADDAATGLLWTAVVVAGLCLLYYFYGLFSGSLSVENFKHLAEADKQRILSNMATASNILQWGLLAGSVLMIFLFYDEGFSGYILLAVAVFLQVLFPLLGSQYFALARTTPSEGADHLYADAARVAWIPGIPGLILIAMDLVRKFIAGLDEARFKKKNLQYGQGIVKQPKARNVFLGDCWNMPYCRPEVRSKCPIFLRKRGPCWRNKRGCMCDETIVLNANSDNYKEKVAAAEAAIQSGGKVKPRPAPVVSHQQNLSDAFKRERCRQCVIYNTHQEQKYKALVAITFVAAAIIFYLFSPIFLDTVKTGYHSLDKIGHHISFGAAATPPPAVNNGRPAPTTGDEALGQGADMSVAVAWVLLSIVSVVVLSKFLNLIEYICFKLKW